MMHVLITGSIVALLFYVFVSGPLQGYTRNKQFVMAPHSEFDITPGSYIQMEHIMERKWNADSPESVIVSPTGELFAGTSDGWLVKLEKNGDTAPVAHVAGRPLGGAVTKDGTGVYVCVAGIGLVFVDLQSKIPEIVSTLSDGMPIRFADDATLASDGKVYFSDASVVAPWVEKSGEYASLGASLVDLLKGSGTGRLLVFDPATRQTTTLLDGLYFANGVALSAEEDFILVAETFGFRITRYWLTGSKAGTVDYFSTRLPGVPDGISRAEDGGFWVAINSKADKVFTTMANSPLLSYIVAHLRLDIIPLPPPFGAVMKLNQSGLPVLNILDVDGIATMPLTSVIEHNGGLYLGSLKNRFVGYIDLEKIKQ